MYKLALVTIIFFFTSCTSSTDTSTQKGDINSSNKTIFASPSKVLDEDITSLNEKLGEE